MTTDKGTHLLSFSKVSTGNGENLILESGFQKIISTDFFLKGEEQMATQKHRVSFKWPYDNTKTGGILSGSIIFPLVRCSCINPAPLICFPEDPHFAQSDRKEEKRPDQPLSKRTRENRAHGFGQTGTRAFPSKTTATTQLPRAWRLS